MRWTAGTPAPEPGDVVVEAFGCDPPPRVRRAHGRQAPRRRCGSTSNTSAPKPTCSAATACRSPQLSGPGRGLRKWFFYPGFERRHRRPASRAGLDGRAPTASTAAPGCAPAACSAAARRAGGQPVLLRQRAAWRSCWSAGRSADAAAGDTRCSRSAPAGMGGDARRRGQAALHRPALAHASRLRPAAVGLRPELRARRRFVRARHVGGRAFRLADLPAARRGARRQARAFLEPVLDGAAPGLRAGVRASGGPGTGWRPGRTRWRRWPRGSSRPGAGATACWRSRTWPPSCSAS